MLERPAGTQTYPRLFWPRWENDRKERSSIPRPTPARSIALVLVRPPCCAVRVVVIPSVPCVLLCPGVASSAWVLLLTLLAPQQFPRFLPPGSRRLAVRAPAALDAVAYLTPQRRVASVLLNKDTAEHCLRLRDVRRGRGVRLCMPPRSLHTVVWDAGGGGGLEL